MTAQEFKPYRHLLAAVLVDAFDTLRRPLPRKVNEARTILMERSITQYWIFEDALDCPLNYCEICRVLGLDAATGRRRARELLTATDKPKRWRKHSCPA